MDKRSVLACFAALFLFGFYETEPTVDLYEPVLNEEQAGEGYALKESEPLKPDSKKCFRGVSLTAGDAQLDCFVKATYFKNVLAVNLHVSNKSGDKAFKMPEKPVTSVIDAGSVSCTETSYDEMMRMIEEKEKAEIKASEHREGEGLFNPVVRKIKYDALKKDASLIKGKAYVAEDLPPGGESKGEIFYNVGSPGRLTVNISFGGKEFTVVFEKAKPGKWKGEPRTTRSKKTLDTVKETKYNFTVKREEAQ